MLELDKFLAALKRYKAETASLDEVIKVFNKLGSLHHFNHYIHDEDIRRNDKGYAKMQNAELNKLILALEAGDLVKANEIHFLSYTD